MWSIGVEVKQETSAPRPKKSPGSASGFGEFLGIKFVYSMVKEITFLKRKSLFLLKFPRRLIHFSIGV